MKRKLIALGVVFGLLVGTLGYIYSQKEETNAATNQTNIIQPRRQKKLEFYTDLLSSYRQIKTKIKLRKKLENENLETRTRALSLIANELANRRDRMEELAIDLIQEENCPENKQDILKGLYNSASQIDSRLNDGSDSQKLFLELTAIIEDDLDIKTSNKSVAYQMARGIYYGKCLNQDGEELLSKYIKFLRAYKNGDCNATEDIARDIGDTHYILKTIRECRGIQQFYRTLETLSEDDLIISASVIPKEEYQPWLSLCQNMRINNNVLEYRAYASCLADLIDQQGKILGTYPLAYELGINSELLGMQIRNLPKRDRKRERVCAILASLQEELISRNNSTEYQSSNELYAQCIGNNN